MKLTEEQAVADPEGVGIESPVEDQGHEMGPSPSSLASEGELPKSCQDSFESSQPEAEASALGDGTESPESGDPQSAMKT